MLEKNARRRLKANASRLSLPIPHSYFPTICILRIIFIQMVFPQVFIISKESVRHNHTHNVGRGTSAEGTVDYELTLRTSKGI